MGTNHNQPTDASDFTQPRRLYAHSLPGKGEAEWEPLSDHLIAVAGLAEGFASSFRAGPWGRLVGLWHDLGKHSDAFQRRLQSAQGDENLEELPSRVDHSTAGAHHAREWGDKIWRLLAYAIAGHHSGLGEASELDRRINSTIEPWEGFADRELLESPPLGLPPLSTGHRDGCRFAFQAAFFARMLLSCLIDANRLATEQFCDADKSAERTPPPRLNELAAALRTHLDELVTAVDNTTVNRCRRSVLEACLAAASQNPGFFSLSVAG